MAASKLALLESRVEDLQSEVASLKAEVGDLKERLEPHDLSQKPPVDWIDLVWGSFANCPAYDEAMELGRKYRESLRPKPARRKSAKVKTKRKSIKTNRTGR